MGGVGGLNDILIRRYRASDKQAVTRIADIALGDGYLTCVGSGATVWVAELDSTVVGFRLWLRQSRCQAETMAQTAFPPRYSLAREFGCLKTVAVAPAYQRHGVGSALLRVVMADMSGQVEVAWSVAWKNGEEVPAGGLLSRAGFEPFAEMPGYWEVDSLARGYACPACGAPPCRCTAILYARSLEKRTIK